MRSSSTVRTSRVVLSLLLLLCVVALACASGPRLRHKHEYTLSPGHEHHAGLEKALLIPIDYTNPKPVRGLEFANDRIGDLIAKHLEAKGIAVERIDSKSFRKVADAAHRRVLSDRKSGASGSVSTEVELGDLVPQVLEELGHPTDLVVAANVVMRSAQYQGTRTIVWDGVRRRETVHDLQMSGSGLPAASVQAAIYTKDGTRTFMGFGGLEPIFRIDRIAEKYVQREDLFEDERNLREGICVAFYPYFGMQEYCAR